MVAQLNNKSDELHSSVGSDGAGNNKVTSNQINIFKKRNHSFGFRMRNSSVIKN